MDELERRHLTDEVLLDRTVDAIRIGERDIEELRDCPALVHGIVGRQQELGAVSAHALDRIDVRRGIAIRRREGRFAVRRRHRLAEHGVGDREGAVRLVPDGQVARRVARHGDDLQHPAGAKVERLAAHEHAVDADEAG
jgi:hypothetical protein